MQKHQLSTQGNVIGIERDYSHGIDETQNHPTKIIMYAPLVKFTTHTGTHITFKGQTYSDTAHYKVGDSIGVIYDPAHPEGALIDTWSETWFWPWLATALGAFLILGGIGTYALIGYIDRASPQDTTRQEEQRQKLEQRLEDFRQGHTSQP